MTLDDIKQAIADGKTVHWGNPAYRVIRDKIGQYLVRCTLNDCYWGLTHHDGVTVNGKPEEFFIGA